MYKMLDVVEKVLDIMSNSRTYVVYIKGVNIAARTLVASTTPAHSYLIMFLLFFITAFGIVHFFFASFWALGFVSLVVLWTLFEVGYQVVKLIEK